MSEVVGGIYRGLGMKFGPEAATSPRQGALGASTSVEISAPSDDAGTMVLREPRRHSARLGSIFSQARKTLDSLEKEYAKEEHTTAEERARPDEALALLYERVELYRRHDASAQAAREEALKFTLW